MSARISCPELLQKLEHMASADTYAKFQAAQESLRAHASYAAYRNYLERNWLNITEVGKTSQSGVRCLMSRFVVVDCFFYDYRCGVTTTTRVEFTAYIPTTA